MQVNLDAGSAGELPSRSKGFSAYRSGGWMVPQNSDLLPALPLSKQEPVVLRVTEQRAAERDRRIDSSDFVRSVFGNACATE